MAISFSLKHLTAKKMFRGLILEKKNSAEEEGESSQTNATSGKGPERDDINHASIGHHSYGLLDVYSGINLARQYPELWVLEMIKTLDEATQHSLLEEFEICRSNGMPTVEELMVKSELRRIERGLDVGGRHKPSEVRIDMLAEHKSFEEAGKSVADRINEGGLGSLISTFSDVPGPPWLRTAMFAAGLVAYVSTAAGYGMRAYNDKLSRILSKVGALAISALVIASLTMPLPSLWAWIVGLAAWLITVISVLSD